MENNFGNKASVTGHKWIMRLANEAKSLTFQQKYGVFPEIADVLSARDDINFDNIESFLNPKVRDLMPDPFSLLDMQLAVDRVISAIKLRQKIVVFGDYDVDGATSSAILKKFFKMLERSIDFGKISENKSTLLDVEIYIPDRIKEGYGPNTNALLELRKNGVDLVITVDCGTVAFEPLEEAANAGLDIIVIDHHISTNKKPKSIAVVNPNRFDELSDLTYLCGAGVSFMLAVAVTKQLKFDGLILENRDVNLISLLDLVALGTICDVMPLVGLNRAFVKTGLEVMRKWQNIGLAALRDIAKLDVEPTEYTCGFVFGPRINAGGRIGKSSLGARILSSTSVDEASQIAIELDVLNVERKEMEAGMLEDALLRVESEKLYDFPIIFIGSEYYHQGIIGLLSARVKDKYYKPTAALAIIPEENKAKASCRSIIGVDIGGAIHKANAAGLLIAGGGHAMAGGFTVSLEKLDELHKFLCDAIKPDVEMYSKERCMLIDSILTIQGITHDFYQNLQLLTPFGVGNPKPLFALKGVSIVKIDIRGEKHASIIFKDGVTQKTIKGIFFKSLEYENSPKLLKSIGKKVDVAFEITMNTWGQQNNLELNIVDILI